MAMWIMRRATSPVNIGEAFDIEIPGIGLLCVRLQQVESEGAVVLQLAPSRTQRFLSVSFLGPRMAEIIPSERTSSGLQLLRGDRARKLITARGVIELKGDVYIRVEMESGRELSVLHWDASVPTGSLVVWAGPPVEPVPGQCSVVDLEYSLCIEALRPDCVVFMLR